MAMEIGGKTLNVEATPAANRPAQRLLALLQLSPGHSAPALVESISPISAEERTLLLASRESGAQLPAPARQKLMAFLARPELQLIELKVNQQRVQTLTDLPLSPGQTLAVKVRPDGQLQLVMEGHKSMAEPKLPGSTATPSTVPGGVRPHAPNPAPSPAQSSQIAFNKPVNTPVDTAANSPANSNAPSPNKGMIKGEYRAGGKLMSENFPLRQTSVNGPAMANDGMRMVADSSLPGELRSAVRQVLPGAEPQSRLLQLADTIINRLQPGSGQANLGSSALSPEGRDALVNLLKTTTREIDWLQRPEATFRRATASSGVFWEHTLKQAAQQGALPERLEQDAKAYLSQLVPPPSSTIAASVRNREPQMPLEQLLQNLMGKASAPSNAHSPTALANASRQLEQWVQQFAQGALARVQLRQYQSVSGALNEPMPSPQLPLHWDIPIRLPEGFFNLYFFLQEQRVKDKDRRRGEDDANRRLQLRWRLYMELELGNDGLLAVDLSVCADDLEIQLWAEQDGVRARATENLANLKKELESQGMTVSQLRCSTSPPPQKNIKLDYNLIDVTT